MKLQRSIALTLIVSLMSCFMVFADEKPASISQSGKEELIQWITATSAIINYSNNKNHRLIDLPRDDSRAKAAKDILSSAWSATDADGLREQIGWLISEGHNEDFKIFYEVVNQLGKEKAASVLGQLGGDVVARIPIIKSTGDKWGDRGIIAWDLFRVGTLVSWGYSAGYIELDEACLLMEPAVSLLKNNFSSWDEAVANYLDAYCYWANVDPAKEGTEYAERKKIYNQLKATVKDLFNDSLFISPYVVNMQKTVAPTPELLKGYWTCKYQNEPYKGAVIQYYFDKNGYVACYLKYLDYEIYSRGSYSIENGILSITYNYINDGEEQISLIGEDMKKEIDTYCFSSDGSQLISIDADLGHTRFYTKADGTSFSKHP